MFTLNNVIEEANNEVIINGYSVGKLTDKDANKLYDIVKGMISQYNGSNKGFKPEEPKKPVVSNVLHVEEEKVPQQPVVGTVMYHTDFIDVTEYKNEYRLYIHVPFTMGRDRAKKVHYAIRETARKYGIKWHENKKYGIYYWTINDAKGFIAEQKKYDAEHRKEKA